MITLSSSQAPSGSGVQAPDLPVPQGCVHAWLLVMSDSWDRIDCGLPGSSVCGILQARLLEWVAISCSRGSSQPRDQTHIPCIGRWVLYHWATRGVILRIPKLKKSNSKQKRFLPSPRCFWTILADLPQCEHPR